MSIRLALVRRVRHPRRGARGRAVVVPDSAVKPTQMELVKINRATGVDYPEGNKDIVWILAVGSDARPGEDMTRVRGDALQLVGMNLRTGAATAIGVPRDSWVSIPGYGSNKINAALYFGGPQALGEAVGGLVGIQPDYVFVSRFKFFQALIGSIGGIEVNNPVAFSDPVPQARGLHAGPHPPRPLRRHGVLADPPQPGPAATSTVRPTSSACCAASRPRSGPARTSPASSRTASCT